MEWLACGSGGVACVESHGVTCSGFGWYARQTLGCSYMVRNTGVDGCSCLMWSWQFLVAWVWLEPLWPGCGLQLGSL